MQPLQLTLKSHHVTYLQHKSCHFNWQTVIMTDLKLETWLSTSVVNDIFTQHKERRRILKQVIFLSHVTCSL